MTGTEPKVPVWDWVYIPAVITLAVTVLRLWGELNHWPKFWFNPDPGGGGSPIGIVWLVPIFGIHFGRKLVRSGGVPPGIAGVVLSSIGGLFLVGLFGLAAYLGGLTMTGTIFSLNAGALAGGCLAYRSWPQMGRILLAYGMAARIPVALLMFFAIYGDWGTHYDVAPLGFPEMGTLAKWVTIGLLPQLIEWVGLTSMVGSLFAVIGAKFGSFPSPQSRGEATG